MVWVWAWWVRGGGAVATLAVAAWFFQKKAPVDLAEGAVAVVLEE